MRKFLGAVSITLISFMLCSCVSEQEQRQINMNKCKNYGYNVGTKAFADCMKDVDFHNDDMDQRDEDRDQKDMHHMDKMDVYENSKKFNW